MLECGKPMTNQIYGVHLRRDPKRGQHFAREIHGFTLECPSREAYEHVAELEAYLKKADPYSVWYTIAIRRERQYADTDEETRLQERYRQRIDSYLPRKLKEDLSQLEEKVDSCINEQGWTKYIG